MGEQSRILLVEDDAAVRALLAAYLTKEGFAVSEAENARQFRARMAHESLDLILLDLNLPDEDGLILARALRQKSLVPFIMVTSREQPADRIVGLELGADDYVTKPFVPRELIARMRNVLRRSGAQRQAREASHGDIRTFGDWTIDLARRLLSDAQGRTTKLTRAEFDLLAALVLADGRVLSRDRLLDAVSRRDDPPLDRTIDVIVSRLRRKLEPNPRQPGMLITVAGHGYRLQVRPRSVAT